MLNEVCSKGLLDYKIVYIYLPENEQALPQLKSTYLWLSHIIQSCQVELVVIDVELCVTA
jgi:hypothetical protein